MSEHPPANGRRAWLPLLAGLALGVALGALIFLGAPSRAAEPSPEFELATVPANRPGLSIGSQAPDFELSQPDGGTVRLQDQQGQVVLLNFWATWCLPCRTEMPLIQETHDNLADQGFIALGIDFDEPAEVVTAFAEELGLDFPLLLDPGGAVQRLYRVIGYPTTVLVDREGRIATYHIGILTKGQLDQYLEQLGMTP